MMDMNTVTMPSVARRRNGEPVEQCGTQTLNVPRSCLTTPTGLCPLSSSLDSPNPSHESTGTGIPFQRDYLRGFGSQRSDETNITKRKVGDHFDFAHWNYEILWSERHKTPEQLEPLRQVGDSLTDGCVAALGVKRGADVLKILEQYLTRPTYEQESDAPRKFQESVLSAPDWVDWNTIRQAQDVYWTYAIPINCVLVHYSLTSGFGSPQIAQTLQCTHYLASPGRSYQRLMETLQFVVDCMNGGIQSLQPGIGKGWASAVRVRLLHAQVRLSIFSLAESHPDFYSVEEFGVPINQEDTAATLCAFSICVVVGLEKMGIYLSLKEVSAYLHLWRLVGHYMGVLPENNPLTSREDALASLESVVRHLIRPDDTSAMLTRSVLRALAEKGPFRLSFAVHSAMARALLGEKYSDALQIESSSFYHSYIIELFFVMFQLFFVMFRCSHPWWRLISRKFITHLLDKEGTETELNFTMKMVPKVFAEDHVPG